MRLVVTAVTPSRFTTRATAIFEAETRRQQAAWNASAELIEARLSIFRAIKEGRLATVTDTVEHVLGRKAITFDQWARENAEAYRIVERPMAIA
jgi:hypothetical protein